LLREYCAANHQCYRDGKRLFHESRVWLIKSCEVTKILNYHIQD